MIAELQDKHPDACTSWLGDMRTLSPDVETIRSVERQDDHYRYVEVRFKNGYSGPSWTLSEGILRSIALSVLVHRPSTERILLVEEPETGLHPAVHGNLLKVLRGGKSQVILTSHSPALLAASTLEDVLCFSSADDGSSEVRSAEGVTDLAEWLKRVHVQDLQGGEVLGATGDRRKLS